MESCVDKKTLAKASHLKVVQNNQKKERIVFVSNAPWASTGYGQQTKQITTRLLGDGYPTSIACLYGLEANSTIYPTTNGPLYCYPRGADAYSNDVIPAHAYDWFNRDPEAKKLIITLFDTWVFKGEKWKDWPVASWVPIDHTPVPPEVAQWCQNDFVTPIAMSKFGQDALAKVGIESTYIPHAIEKVYEPTEHITDINGDQISSRELMGIPEDAFVVGMNAANKGIYPCRKAFGENLLAFAMFAKDKKDVYLYLHSDAEGSLGGIRLNHLLIACGIDREKVIFADPYQLRYGYSQEQLACIYTGMDVLLATSYGEGFGIPTIEAQACGTPVIVSNFAASAELCGDGWLIEGQPLWDAPQKSWFHVPSVPEIIKALEESYKRDRIKSIKAMEFAQDYLADAVYEKYWKPFLKQYFKQEQKTLIDGVK
jgi:glycosyltransferase involved in cell wall biosynthesis